MQEYATCSGIEGLGRLSNPDEAHGQVGFAQAAKFFHRAAKQFIAHNFEGLSRAVLYALWKTPGTWTTCPALMARDC
jgi:hypothetical protein